MSAWMREDQRKLVMQRRRKPDSGTIVHIPFEGVDNSALRQVEAPAELHLDPTGPTGETALWLDDFFWLELLQQWPGCPLAIHFHPTRNSLLHPVILHQLTMLRRVAPGWRLVGYCYLSDLEEEGRPSQAALTVHHEIHVIDASRPAAPRSTRPLHMEDTLRRMRQIQTANKRTTPILTCYRPRLKTADAVPQQAETALQHEEPVAIGV